MAVVPVVPSYGFFVSFEEGFRQKKLSEVAATKEDRVRFEKIKVLFEKNFLAPVSLRGMPKKIHQIWIGPKPVPSYLSRYREKCKQLHSDCEYHLWTQKELEEEKFPDQDLVDKVQNWGQKTDIYKAAILQRFGGLVLDADVCVRIPLHLMFEKYDFFAGLEQPRDFVANSAHLFAGVAVIGASPDHPIINLWREKIREKSELVAQKYGEDPRAMVLHATYYPFTEAVLEKADQKGFCDIVFPPTYFYATHPEQESFAIHHSAEEWLS